MIIAPPTTKNTDGFSCSRGIDIIPAKTGPVIGIGILLLIGAIYIAKVQWEKKQHDVKGVQTQNTSFALPNASSLSIGNNLQKELGNIQNQATHLNIAEVASSSPQIQKIIRDLQDLQQYPRSQAKDMCQKICNGL